MNQNTFIANRKIKYRTSEMVLSKSNHSTNISQKQFFPKKQHNHIKLPHTVSALNSRFFENIVIPSKLDANRIIKF
eukprot:UN09926